MDLFDIQSTVSILKSMKPYLRAQYFESQDGKDFVNDLFALATTKESKEAVAELHKAIGSPELVKGAISLKEINQYTPTQLAVPVDRTPEMMSFPDKRLNSDHVYRAVGARVLEPQQYWTKQSDLCYMFKASPESIEAALLTHVGEGRIAFENNGKQMLFAKI